MDMHFFSTDVYVFGGFFLVFVFIAILFFGSKNYKPKNYSSREKHDLFHEGSRHLMNDDPHDVNP